MTENFFLEKNDPLDFYLMRNNNRTILEGIVEEEIKLSSEYFWEDEYYTTKISVQRKSGAIDMVPMSIPKSLAEELEPNLKGKFIRTTGQIRSYDLHMISDSGDPKHKLLVFFVPDNI